MKTMNFKTIFCFVSLLHISGYVLSQTEIGLRPLFYQNDFSKPSDGFDGTSKGNHAGEWQLGASVRHYFRPRIPARLESNFTHGRYSLSNERFSYFNFCAMPEWRVTKRLFLGAGGFLNIALKDDLDLQPQKAVVGHVSNIGFRTGHFEIQFRYQQWLGSERKFTLGAGLDYFFALSPKSDDLRGGSPGN